MDQRKRIKLLLLLEIKKKEILCMQSSFFF